MMILDCVELPYPPSVNHYWEPCVYKKRGRIVRGRRKSEKALKFIADMKLLARRKNASLLQHCRDHGLKYFCVKEYVKRNKVSPQAAMDAYRAGAVRRVYWGKPQ